MLRAMSSVTPINSGRLSATPPVDPPAGETFVAGDLVAAMDDHSRALLGRSDLERRIRLVPRSLMIADLLGLSLAYLVTTLFWGGSGAFGSTKQLVVFCCTLPCWLVVAKLQGLYRADQEHADHSTADDIVKVFYLVTIGVWILLVASRLAGHAAPGTYALITFWALTICIVPMVRTATRRLCRRSRAYVQNTLILGAGEVGQLIARKLVRHAEYGLNVVGFLDREPKARRGDLPDHLGILGGPERLAEVVKSLDVERVIIAFSKEPEDELLVLLRQLRAFPVQIDLVPRLFELVGPRVMVHSVEGLPLLGLPPNHASPIARALKRAIDVTVSGAGAHRARAAVRLHSAADPPGLGRSGVLPPNATRHEYEGVHGAEVPDHESRHRPIGPPGGGPPVERRQRGSRRHERDVQAGAHRRGDRFRPRPAPHQS